MLRNNKKQSSTIWDEVWTGTTIDEQLQNLQKDDYFENITSTVALLQKKGLVLEAGCGLGRWVFYLKELGFNTIGIDNAKSAIRKANEYAKQRGKNADFVLADVRYLPFRKGCFRFILSLGVVEHFVQIERETILKESYRCLRKKGLFFVSTPNAFFLAHSFLRFCYRLIKKWKIGFEKSFTPKDLTLFLEKQRFRVVRQKIFGFKLASTKVIVFFPFFLPFMKFPAFRNRILNLFTSICKSTRLLGFYACVLAIKIVTTG